MKIKTCIDGWPNDTAKSSQLARNHSIVWIRPRSHLTITKQLGLSWFELTEVAKRWKTWLKPTQLHRSCELGSSWEDRLARAYRVVSGVCTSTEDAGPTHPPWSVFHYPITFQSTRGTLEGDMLPFTCIWINLETHTCFPFSKISASARRSRISSPLPHKPEPHRVQLYR